MVNSNQEGNCVETSNPFEGLQVEENNEAEQTQDQSLTPVLTSTPVKRRNNKKRKAARSPVQTENDEIEPEMAVLPRDNDTSEGRKTEI